MNSTNSTGEKSHEGGNILSGQNPIQFNLADPLPLFIVQTVIILSLCYTLNLFMHRIRQPKVVSEVLSGIILGPSILGKIPGFNDAIFPPQSIPFLTLVANLGLVLFLFLVGLELDPKLILKRAKHALGISIAGLLIPFVFSCGIAILLYRQFEEATPEKPSPPFGQFLLTCGVAMSLTAFPVLARILAEMQLMSTSVGFITVCAAAAGDIVAWILLALLVSLINATTPIMPLYVVLMAIAWCIILVYAVRPLLMSLVRLTHSEEEPSQKMIAITLVIVLSSAFVTNIIGIHAIFGGFLVGLLIPHDSGFAEGLTRRIEDLVGVYFLPIFFACSGLKTQVGLLNNGQTWGLVILVTVVSCFGKMLGCTTAAKANGMTWREAFSIGFLMNCKGLVEYIILNIGHDAGVISDRVFVIMIAMCLILTMIATPFVEYLYPVSYQKELEIKREAERKLGITGSKSRLKHDNSTSGSSGGLLSGLRSKLRRRKGGQEGVEDKNQRDIENVSHVEGLDGVRVDVDDHYTINDDAESKGEKAWKNRNSIMFCLDKTPNAPGVMTLLQLFSGTALSRHQHNTTRATANEDNEKVGRRSEQRNKRYEGILQPSIDISDPNGNSRARRQSELEYEINYSKIYAIRLLHISERTSAAMLTASRCMDRLYKDTVMMMVMAFAKLNSVPLKPLVAISTDIAQSTVAHDVLDRAEDLNVGWIVYPWNSSHLTDLPSSTAGYPTGGSHLHPGLMMSMANMTASATTGISVPPALGQNQAFAGSSVENLAGAPRQFPYNVSRYFDHDEAQKIASGGHVDLSQGGQSHRTSIASNTKVLSKLIPASAESNIATAILVDRGLGLFGGVEHIVVPILGGEDDYEALCLASCLARSTHCFVTILRISSTQGLQDHPNSLLSQDQNSVRATHPRHLSSDRSVPPTPDLTGRHLENSRAWRQAAETVVPKDDATLFKNFFPGKAPFQGGQTRHQQRIMQRNISLDRTGHNIPDLSEDELEPEEGVMVLTFQELSDAVQWARTCLTAQDLMVMGFDSNVSMTQAPTPSFAGPSQVPTTIGFSRVPSMEVQSQAHQHSASAGQPYSPPRNDASAPTLLERRGINLSPVYAESPNSGHLSLYQQRLQPPQDSSFNSSSVSTPAVVSSGTFTPLPRASFDEERPGRLRAADAERDGRSRSKGARPFRSLSRGRKAETPSAGPGSPLHASNHTGSDALTTCQVMLGLAADKMIQSGVVSSLLTVRSRWFSLRKQTSGQEMSPPFSGRSHFRLHTTSTGTSHQRGSSTDHRGQDQHVLDQTRQYHSQQKQHHARQHSKMSQEVMGDLKDMTDRGSLPSTRPRIPDVIFVDLSGGDRDSGGSRASTDAILGRVESNDMATPRMSRESV